MKLDVTKTKRITNGFLKLEKWYINLPNGKKIIREVIIKKDGIAVLAITPNKEIYLTKQPRAGINELESIEIPAGLIEDGEKPEYSAERELLEETGCKLTQPLISLGTFVADPSCSTSVTHLFLALNVQKVNDLKLDNDEYLECFTRSIDRVYWLLNYGNIRDANSVIALERARKYIRSL